MSTIRPFFIVVAAAIVLLTGAMPVAATSGTASPSPTARHLNMLDDCDPASFNAVIGPGTCTRTDPGTSFQEFIGQLLATGQAPAWRFAPTTLALPAGASIVAFNKGGEDHTFTEVANFGGGCVQVLDDVLGLSPLPECGNPALFPGTLVEQGDSLRTAPLAPGVHLFECLIHPWMRTTVTVK
jgi:plastocyanin